MRQRLNYLGNSKLKAAGVPQNFTPEQITEIIKCSKDPVYFAKQYVKITSLDKGLVNFEMWPWQVKMIEAVKNSRFVITKIPRQSGKSITALTFILYSIIFNSNYSVAIFANKSSTANSLLKKVKLAYEHLPLWLQQGVVEWNKTSVELENGSTVVASTTTESTGRSGSFNLVLLDEFAFIPNTMADEFMKSAYPTITAGETTKIIIVSTPKGMNHFYKLWQDAVKGRSLYVPVEVHWSEIPGRDEKWREETIRNIGQEAFNQEYGCEFFGEASETLVSPLVLKTIDYETPITSIDGLDTYERPKDNSNYILTVDVSRGTGDDYSAFVVTDVTNIPYKIVAKYRNNQIAPLVFPDLIRNVAVKYNTAFVLVEINDSGGQIADTLFYDLEYENLFFTKQDKRVGGEQKLELNTSKKMRLGLRMTKSVKRIGCASMKTLVEERKLLIPDFDIISELTTFVRSGYSYKAEEGCNDDLAMCLVMFGWLINQRQYKHLLGSDIRASILNQESPYKDLVPFVGYDRHDDSLTITGENKFVEDGCVWETAHFGFDRPDHLHPGFSEDEFNDLLKSITKDDN